MLLSKANLEAAKFIKSTRLPDLHITNTATEATDGHLAVRVALPREPVAEFPACQGRDPVENGGPLLITPGDAAQIAKALPKPSETRRYPILQNAALLETADGQETYDFAVTNGQCGQIFNIPGQAGKFPDLDSIMRLDRAAQLIADVLVLFTGIPRPTPIEPIAEFSVDAKLLASLCAFFAKYQGKDKAVIRVSVYADNKPIGLRNYETAEQQIEAVLMPCRPETE